MQGNDALAVGACPLFFFFEQMSFRADGFDANAIVDQTDLVPLPVTFVEALDGRTGKRRTLEAKINSMTGDTVFYLALSAMFGLAGVLSATTEAGLLLAEMHIADSAGDSTGSQHVRWDGYYFHGVIFIPSPQDVAAPFSFCQARPCAGH